MKVAVFSTNLSFFGPVEAALKADGHELTTWRENPGEDGKAVITRLLKWCDVAYVDFCQTPLREVVGIAAMLPHVVLAARLHRIEIYNSLVADKNLNWGRVDTLFGSAPHVIDRFMAQRAGLSKPKQIIHVPTNLADPALFQFTERRWEPPFRLCMLGNFVPKKRQYTLIQCMHDIREQHGEDFLLDIVGSRGLWSGYGNPEYFQNCLDLIKDLELEKVVTNYEKLAHEDVPGFLAREHAIISNSNEEGTHVAIAEAAMTGCIPFVNTWRGARTVYSEDVAWHFRSPAEFVRLCGRLKLCASKDELSGASKDLSQKAREKYGDLSQYQKMVNLLKGKVAERPPRA